MEKGETTEDAEDTLAGDIGGMKGKKLLSVTGAFSRLSPCNLPHKQVLGAKPDQSFDARPGNIDTSTLGQAIVFHRGCSILPQG